MHNRQTGVIHMRWNTMRLPMFVLSMTAAMSSAPSIAAAAESADAAQQATASSTAGAASSAASTASAGGELGEIIVTAQRRANSLSDVPISISAYDQRALDSIGARTIEDVTSTIPGINIRPGFEQSPNLSIRGITSPTVGSATTGIYIDDTPIQVRNLGSLSHSAYPVIFDLERVEVLRGPQGTLFGAGSEGGALRFITPSPNLEDSSIYARSEVGFTENGDPSYELGIAGGAPIIPDSLGFRASIYQRENGGWVDRAPYPGDITARNINSSYSTAADFAVTYKPFAALTLTPAVYLLREHSDDLDEYWPSLSNPSQARYVSGQLFGQPTTEQLELPSFKVQMDWSAATLISNTSYLNHTLDHTADYSFVLTDVLTENYRNPHPPSPSTFEDPQQAFTQEVRIQSPDSKGFLTWVAGVFYQDGRQQDVENIYSPGLGEVTQVLGFTVQQLFGVPLLPGGISGTFLNTSRDRQTALFGDVTLRLLPELSFELGLRAERAEFAFTNDQFGPLNGGTTSVVGGTSETPVSPKFGLDYKPNADWLVYASASKGYRLGGGNPPIPDASCAEDLNQLGLKTEPAEYKSDTTWSYELGSKLKSANNRLQIEGSVFYIDWRNTQTNVDLLHCGFSFIDNLGGAVSKGFDLQESAEVLDGLVLRSGIGYTDATVSHNLFAEPGVPIATEGDRLDTPPWHVSVSSDYSIALADGTSREYLHVQYDYDSGYSLLSPKDTSYDPYVNHDTPIRQLDARIGHRAGPWDLSLYVNNLLDSLDRTTQFHEAPGPDSLLYFTGLRPRTIGITVAYRN
jgi:iron complex outermembrane recepter protein